YKVAGNYKADSLHGAFAKTVRENETLKLPPWVILAGFEPVAEWKPPVPVVDGVSGAPALMENTDAPAARLMLFTNDRSIIPQGGRHYFDDRNYGGWEPKPPAWLDGRLFFESSASRSLTYRALRGGSVIVLAPANLKRDYTERLAKPGLKPLKHKTFYLFATGKNNDLYQEENLYGGFTKTLADNETLTLPPWAVLAGFEVTREDISGAAGELLYNGIKLPSPWPPKVDYNASENPAPWLGKGRPAVVPIDIGRQLFVDDFLIEKTDTEREFHQPEKYSGNPVLKAGTSLELGQRDGQRFVSTAMAGPNSGGMWWNPESQVYEYWYSAGWMGTVAYATSKDGIHWDRPELNVHKGTNQTLPDAFRVDSWTVFRDDDCPDPQKRFKLFFNPPYLHLTSHHHSRHATSPDGKSWPDIANGADGGFSGDRSTAFYNPFRKKWVYSLRWYDPSRNNARVRRYWESSDFERGMKWRPGQPVPWAGADSLDLPDERIGEKPQLYNLDAVAYESLMLGMFQIHVGPSNEICARDGTPKCTGLKFAYSRDGFHWHRPDRSFAIPYSYHSGTWDRGYVQSLGNVCVLNRDKIYFYYVGFSGVGPDGRKEMHQGGATGLAMLRRDGFCSMNAGKKGGGLLTRPLKFSGKHLFVNAVAPAGIRAEICDEKGRAIPPFTLDNCEPFTGDSTLAQLAWRGGGDLSALAGKPVRVRFQLSANSKLYAFWVSRDETGRSDGYVAGGGPGYTGPRDTVGKAAPLGAEHP
ncbi:MAG: hypothetical protein LBC18_00420, partial [Opitutaceae bacterium]|nr:hypothetical protein [Opitutaceae bacterium]